MAYTFATVDAYLGRSGQSNIDLGRWDETQSTTTTIDPQYNNAAEGFGGAPQFWTDEGCRTDLNSFGVVEPDFHSLAIQTNAFSDYMYQEKGSCAHSDQQSDLSTEVCLPQLHQAEIGLNVAYLLGEQTAWTECTMYPTLYPPCPQLNISLLQSTSGQDIAPSTSGVPHQVHYEATSPQFNNNSTAEINTIESFQERQANNWVDERDGVLCLDQPKRSSELARYTVFPQEDRLPPSTFSSNTTMKRTNLRSSPEAYTAWIRSFGYPKSLEFFTQGMHLFLRHEPETSDFAPPTIRNTGLHRNDRPRLPVPPPAELNVTWFVEECSQFAALQSDPRQFPKSLSNFKDIPHLLIGKSQCAAVEISVFAQFVKMRTPRNGHGVRDKSGYGTITAKERHAWLEKILWPILEAHRLEIPNAIIGRLQDVSDEVTQMEWKDAFLPYASLGRIWDGILSCDYSSPDMKCFEDPVIFFCSDMNGPYFGKDQETCARIYTTSIGDSLDMSRVSMENYFVSVRDKSSNSFFNPLSSCCSHLQGSSSLFERAHRNISEVHRKDTSKHVRHTTSVSKTASTTDKGPAVPQKSFRSFKSYVPPQTFAHHLVEMPAPSSIAARENRRPKKEKKAIEAHTSVGKKRKRHLE